MNANETARDRIAKRMTARTGKPYDFWAREFRTMNAKACQAFEDALTRREVAELEAKFKDDGEEPS